MSIKLKVEEAQEEYIGRNIVTLNIDLKQKLNIISGDVVEIKGNKKTCAQVWPEKSEDSRNIIKMDQYIRRNCGVSIGDFVDIKKIKPKVAEQITLSPIKKIDFLYKNYDLIIKKNFLGRPFSLDDNVMINVFGSGYMFVVTKTKPSGAVILSESTNLVVLDKPKSKIQRKKIIGYEDVGGLKKQIEQIREMVELPVKYPKYFKKLNITPPKGILLHGPPGTGKTLLARAISNELKAKFISLDAPQVMAKYVGEAEQKIRKIFKDGQRNAPAVIFIDEIDAIASKRDSLNTEVEKRVVAQLLASMDGISSRGQVVVIGATNRSEQIDPALRRPGRFDREIEIGVPNQDSRLEILKIHTRNVPLEKKLSLKKIAKKTHGFIGADLAVLVKEAGISAIKDAISKIKKPKYDDSKILEDLKIRKKDFNKSLKDVQPSALREVFVETPQIDLKEVGGLEEQKEIFEDIINLSLNNKEVVKKMGLDVPKNLLLYGPPGTGKTMLVKACAKSFGINFLYVKGPEVLNKWLGESEKTIREIFKKASDVSPCILFFDEIDSLSRFKSNQETVNESKVLDQLLTELDNISYKDIIFVGATNRPDIIDSSLLRSGRMDKIIEFKIPSKKQRKKILKVLLKDVPKKDLNIDEIVKQTEDFSGADLDLLVRESILLALKENKYKKTKLRSKYVNKIIKKIKPKIETEDREEYSSFKSKPSVAKYIS